MTPFKEVLLAGSALCCVMFALDISMPPAPTPDQGDTDQPIMKISAPDSPIERNAGPSAAGSPPATEHAHDAQAETAAVAAPAAREAFASVENGGEQKHIRQKRDTRRARPKSSGTRLAAAPAAPPRTWNDNSWSWSWNQNWQGQSDTASRSGAARPAPPRSASAYSGTSWNYYRPRSAPPNSGCPWC